MNTAVAESQTFLRARTSPALAAKSEEKRLFSQARKSQKTGQKTGQKKMAGRKVKNEEKFLTFFPPV